MATISRMSPQQARQHMQGNGALLVCAYDNAEKWQQNRLAGAISLPELQARLPHLARDQELIFYCA